MRECDKESEWEEVLYGYRVGQVNDRSAESFGGKFGFVLKFFSYCKSVCGDWQMYK